MYLFTYQLKSIFACCVKIVTLIIFIYSFFFFFIQNVLSFDILNFKFEVHLKKKMKYKSNGNEIIAMRSAKCFRS